MAIVATDWTITRATGIIDYTGNDHGGGSPSYATVIEFHRWVQDLADDPEFTGSTGDELDIIDNTPSDRSTDNIITLINGFTITPAAAEHLYDGSVISGDIGVDRIVYDGIVNFGNADVQIQIMQDGVVLVDDWWNFSGAGLNADPNAGISHRFMLKTHDFAGDGGDIDGRRLVGTTRTFGNTYAEFKINGTSNGNNVLALVDSNDLNNDTAEGTVATWTTIDNTTEGFVQLDVNNNGSDEDYYSEWNRDTYTINQFYERMKWLTRDGSTSTLYGLNGELFRGITHELDVDGGTGTWGTPEHEEITWGSGATAGTARLLAVDNKTGSSATKIWFQILTGVVPADNATITGTTSTATADAELSGGALTERPISTPFVGASTGSALIGSYGLSLETADLSASDTVFDLTNTAVYPPNNVTFTVGGVVSGEDRVLVTNNAAGDIDFTQMALASLLNGATVTAVDVGLGNIPADTPSTGTIRIERDDGLYSRHPFSVYDSGNQTFTITSHDFSANNASAANDVFVSYIDKLAAATSESFTTVYDADRTLFVRVRDGGTAGDNEGIKTAETTGVLGTNGGSVTINRISDV